MQNRFSVAVSLGFLAVTTPLEATTPAEIGGCEGTVPSQVITANPSNFESVIPGSLQAGDLVPLEAGTYSGGDLDIDGLHGTEDGCIIIEGPASGSPAVFLGSDNFNTVSIQDSSYVVIRNLELDGQGSIGDGIKLEFQTVGHHVTLENLYVHDHDGSDGGGDQQIVCLNTKGPAWNWVVRNNRFERCGTGAYFGNSDGAEEFVNSLIEYNLFTESIGYNLQIKYQNSRDTGAGSPANGTTVVRHNVMAKGANSSQGGNSRPNLLLGAWPDTGPGSSDTYLVYGNFLYENPTCSEPLFQGEGNIALYDNLLLNDCGPGILIRNQNGAVKEIQVFHNTIVSEGTGIRVRDGEASASQEVRGNAVFAPFDDVVNFIFPIWVDAPSTEQDNTTDSPRSSASTYLNSPFGDPGVDLDLYPLDNGLLQGAVDTTGLSVLEDWDRDFNDTLRSTSFRGAYAGQGTNPGWALALERKTEIGQGAIFSDGFESGNTGAWTVVSP
jgi:hypothetical protein